MTNYPSPGSLPLGPVSQPASADLAARDEWSGAECVRVLRRHKLALASITGLGVLVAALFSVAQPRMYRSEASLEVQPVNENFLDLHNIYPTAAASADAAGSYVQTQAEILQQNALLEQVVRKLSLEQRPEFQDVGWLRNRGAATPVQIAVEGLKKNLEIVSSRGSRIIRIVSDAGDPQVAAGIANTLAQMFIDQNIKERQHAALRTRAMLTPQLQALRHKLLRSELELRELGPSAGQVTLRREVDADRQFYQAMAQKAADAGVASEVTQSNFELVGPAQPAPEPFKPNLPLNLAIGTVGGLILAIGSIMLREQTRSVLRAPGEAGTYLTLPEFGAIPRAAVNRTLASVRPVSFGPRDLSVERAALEQRFSDVSESFRATLASMLLPRPNGERPHLFVVTSSRPMEGKTTVVSNLGIVLAEISGRVLLIDGDMRRPRLHKVFGQANSWGLSDVLSEKNAIEDLQLDVLVKKTAIPHLSLLPSGACTDNVFSLLCSGRLGRLLPRFRQEFDYVLVDAPPCLEFADARIMARHAEELLLVVQADSTDRKTVQAAVQRLTSDGIPLMGVILNRWNPAGNHAGYAPYDSVNGHGLA